MIQPRLFEGNFREDVGISAMAEAYLERTDWQMPTSFPDLSRERVTIDIESYDPFLHTRGPGFVHGEAHVIGVAVCTPNFAGYYPTRHLRGPNFDPALVARWLRDITKGDNEKAGANFLYDLEGLHFEGVQNVGGNLLDIQNAEGIIDEESALIEDMAEKGFALDKLSRKYLGEHKAHGALESAMRVMKCKNMSEVKKRMRELPAWAGPGTYAIADAILTMRTLEKQEEEIRKQDLGAIWKLETALVPILLKMRLKGVRVDLEAAEALSKRVRARVSAKHDAIKAAVGFHVNPRSSKDMVRLCEAMGVSYTMTPPSKNFPDGQPSFTSSWLGERTEQPFKDCEAIKKLEKLNGDFVEGVVLKRNLRGRIHTQFHQSRRDKEGVEGGEVGARTGRFSCTNPNLQQIPIREDEDVDPDVEGLAFFIRALFIPEEDTQWGCHDYKAQEPRLTVHYAHLLHLPGSAEAVAKYNNDPNTDYHKMVAEMAGISRPNAKIMNLMLAYGAGKKKLAFNLKFITEAQFMDPTFKTLPQGALDLFALYHERVPFVKGLSDKCTEMANNRGYVITLLKRKRHFDLWEPNEWGAFGKALPFALAKKQWENKRLRRYGTHKALNALIQGSAADMLKKALVDLAAAGYIPQLIVHDEVDMSHGSEREFREVQQIMMNAVKLAVPVLVDSHLAENWGKAK